MGDLAALELEHKAAAVRTLLSGALGQHGRLVYSNSLGAEAMVLTDIIWSYLPQIDVFSIDTGRLYEVSPLLDWTEAEVWQYIRARRLPYNRLHDRQFPSIGCSPCTRAIQPGESRRAGRWWWEQAESRECGLQPRVPPAAVPA